MTAYASTAKAYKGWGMEGATAKWYASLTHKSLKEFKSLADRISREISPHSNVLEVAPGPGYFAVELAKLGDYRITGLDISATMVQIARVTAADAGVCVDFRHGNASAMPFAGESFDFLLCRAAFKNFSQPQRALEEMYRVLKPGGEALIIDLRRDASPDSIRDAVERMHVSPINRIITRLTFRHMLLPRAYTKAEFERLAAQTKFSSVEIREDNIALEMRLTR